MPNAKILLIALLFGVPAWAGAQSAPQATSQPEVFSGTAQAKNATGAVSGTLEVRLRRVTPEFDRQSLPTGCRLGNNADAFTGGFRLWENASDRSAR